MSRELARRWAPWVMAAALALAPAYVIRPHLGPLPTTVLELALLVAIAFGGWAFWGDLPWHNPYTWPALLLLAGATIDTVLAPDRKAAAGIWKAYFVEPMLAALVIAAIATTRERARILLGGLGVAGAIAALLNVANSLQKAAAHQFDTVTPPVAIYNSANDVPLYLVPLAALALCLLLFSDDRLERWAAAAFLGLAAVAVLLSLSRSGWIAFAAVMVFVALFSRQRWKVAGGVVLVGAAGFLASGTVRHRVLVEFSPNDPNNTINLRRQLWSSALNMLSHRPFQGGGLAGFQASVQPYRDPQYIEKLIYPHNLVLNFWSETGLIGLAGFAWLFGAAAWACRKALAADPWTRLLSIAVLAMLLDYLLHGLTDVPYFKNDLALEFWALLGLQLAAWRAASTRDNSRLA